MNVRKSSKIILINKRKVCRLSSISDPRYSWKTYILRQSFFTWISMLENSTPIRGCKNWGIWFPEFRSRLMKLNPVLGSVHFKPSPISDCWNMWAIFSNQILKRVLEYQFHFRLWSSEQLTYKFLKFLICSKSIKLIYLWYLIQPAMVQSIV